MSGGSSSEAVAALKLRVRFSKTGKIRFISAIDLGRIWERSLRQADLPIAYSEGFSPHPKVSFTEALPLGYASSGEYAELQFAIPVATGTTVDRLNAAFPDGLQVVHAVGAAEGEPKLAKRLRASCWDIEYPSGEGLEAAVAAALAADALPVERVRKGDPITVDLQPAVHQLSTVNRCVRVTLHHVEPQVRPTEVDLALRIFCPRLDEPVLVTRLAQGLPDEQGLREALSGELVPPLHFFEESDHQ